MGRLSHIRIDGVLKTLGDTCPLKAWLPLLGNATLEASSTSTRFLITLRWGQTAMTHWARFVTVVLGSTVLCLGWGAPCRALATEAEELDRLLHQVYQLLVDDK